MKKIDEVIYKGIVHEIFEETPGCYFFDENGDFYDENFPYEPQFADGSFESRLAQCKKDAKANLIDKFNGVSNFDYMTYSEKKTFSPK
jgi:hypothetical protein